MYSFDRGIASRIGLRLGEGGGGAGKCNWSRGLAIKFPFYMYHVSGGGGVFPRQPPIPHLNALLSDFGNP